MAFKPVDVPNNSEEGLPWVKDFIDSIPESDDFIPKEFSISFLVRECYFGDKGITFITKSFKAFLFKSHPYYSFTKEALTVWTNDKGLVPGLALQLSESKPYVVVGLEDEVEVEWKKEKKGALFVSSLPNQNSSTTGETSINPLLKTVPSKSLNTQGKQRQKGKGLIHSPETP